MSALLASLHPFLVHFAVAFVLGGAVLDAAGLLRPHELLERTGRLLLLLAVPFVLAAVITGNLAEGFARPGVSGPLLDAHITAANITAWTFFGAIAWRTFLTLRRSLSGMRRIAYVCVIAIVSISVFVTARDGGRLRHHGYGAPAPQSQQKVLP
jgi:uncharacterized membrane protein